jgi:epsilon-lactone hydrolase
VTARAALARWLIRRLVRPGLAPGRPLEWRRRRAALAASLLPRPRDVRRVPAGSENQGGEWLLPPGTTPDSARGAVLYVHGGGFVLGSPATHRGVAAQLARLARLPVLAVHYRLAPEAPYPAGLQDVEAAWDRINCGGRAVAVAGDSAGGWLALALALRAESEGLPRPAGLALFSPVLDFPRAAARSLQAADAMLPRGFVAEGVDAWRGGIAAEDPRFDLLGSRLESLPPLFLSFDADELLAEDCRRLAVAAEAAGVQVRVEEQRGLWHAWPLFAGLVPEAGATLRAAAAMLVPATGPRTQS